MNKTQYQLFAVSILVGAPLLVSVVANAIPGIHDAASVASDARAQPADTEAQPDPAASAPPPPPPPPAEMLADGSMSAGAAVDPAGIQVAGVDPVISGGADPAASAASLELPNDVPPGQLSEGEKEFLRQQKEGQ